MLATRLRLGGAYAASPFSDFTLTAAADGGWTWFTDPRAVYYNGKAYFGYVDNSGNICIRTYTHATATVSAETVLHAALQVDDHANPSILIRDSDKKLLVFYSSHDDTTMRLQISTTYPNVVLALDVLSTR